MITIWVSNRLDPDQAWQNVRPDLVPNCLQRFSGVDTGCPSSTFGSFFISYLTILLEGECHIDRVYTADLTSIVWDNVKVYISRLTQIVFIHDFCRLLSHLLICLGSLDCKQYWPDQKAPIGAIWPEFNLFASIKILSELDLSIYMQQKYDVRLSLKIEANVLDLCSPFN